MTDDDKIWDRADFSAASAWNELDDFLKGIAPPSSQEEKEKLKAEFLALMDRANAKALDIFKRASNGDRAPHLTEVKRNT